MTADTVSEDFVDNLRRREKDYAASIMASDNFEELGAGYHYILRLENNLLLREAEWEVLRYLCRTFTVNSLVVEIGCGWGQFLVMAAACGFSGVGIDANRERLHGGRHLRDLVESDFSGTAGRLSFRRGVYPTKWQAGFPEWTKGPIIAYLNNLGSAHTEEFCDACLAELRRFDFVIIDLVRCFADRVNPAAQRNLLESMEAIGIRCQAEICTVSGEYRFVALSVGKEKLPLPQAFDEDILAEPAEVVLDVTTCRPWPARSSFEVLTEQSSDCGMQQIVRIIEDSTAANSHDLRIECGAKTAPGSYELTVALRPRGRKAACICLHKEWRDQIRINVRADSGNGFVELLNGDTFRLSGFRIAKEGDWTRLTASINARRRISGIAVAVQLLDEQGRRYYDGDGKAAIDVGALRLQRIYSD